MKTRNDETQTHEDIETQAPTDTLSKKNLIVVGAGLVIFMLGFLFLYLVKGNPEGPMGFVAPMTLLAGIIVIPVGFLIK